MIMGCIMSFFFLAFVCGGLAICVTSGVLAWRFAGSIAGGILVGVVLALRGIRKHSERQNLKE